MEILALIGGISGIVALVWKVGEYVSSKTSNKYDDAVFAHPELQAAIVAILERLLAKKVVVVPATVGTLEVK